MKANQLIAVFAVAGLCLCAQGAFAQGNDDPPPPMSSYDESESTPTEGYNEKVTIDEGAEAGASSNASTGFSAEPERKERLRVYSGKHDGNNVIYDPR